MRQQAHGMSGSMLCYFASSGNPQQLSLAVSEVARRGTRCTDEMRQMGFIEVQQWRGQAAARQQAESQQTYELGRQLMQPPPNPPSVNCTTTYMGNQAQTTCR